MPDFTEGKVCLKDDILKVLEYLQDHSYRLELDIHNASKGIDYGMVQFYQGSKQSTETSVRLIKDILERSNIDYE